MQLKSTGMLEGPSRAQLELWGNVQCHHSPLSFCGCSCGSDRAPGGTCNCPVPPAPSQKTHHPAAPRPGHSWPQICLLFCICHRLRNQPNLVELFSLPGKARQNARAGQGRTLTGQQWDQTSLPFLTNKDHHIAETNHQLHLHWSPLSITGTTWQLNEKSQSKGLKFTFRKSSSGPGSPPGPC